MEEEYGNESQSQKVLTGHGRGRCHGRVRVQRLGGRPDQRGQHSRSLGGLDIYGKPMVDAMTLAVEEANAAGGLLGRQIKLINYDTQSNMQLYTQFAQQAALKDKVAVVHGGITPPRAR